MQLAKDVWLILAKYYPDHPWYVACSIAQGIIRVMLPCFSNYSYVILMRDVNGPNELDAKAKKAGGAFLECFDVPRIGLDVDHFREALTKAPLNGQGHPEDFIGRHEKQQSFNSSLHKMVESLKAAGEWDGY